MAAAAEAIVVDGTIAKDRDRDRDRDRIKDAARMRAAEIARIEIANDAENPTLATPMLATLMLGILLPVTLLPVVLSKGTRKLNAQLRVIPIVRFLVVSNAMAIRALKVTRLTAIELIRLKRLDRPSHSGPRMILGAHETLSKE